MKTTMKIVSLVSIISIIVCSIALCFVGCNKQQADTTEAKKSVMSVASVTMTMESVLNLSANITDKIGTVTLTATINPTTAADKSVTWTMGWATTNSWTSGKNVSDYVTLTQSSTNQLVATVQAKKPFATKINVVCTSTINPEAKATCVLDYGQRLSTTGSLCFAHGGNVISSDGVQTVSALYFPGLNPYMVRYAQAVTLQDSYKTDYTVPVSNRTVTYSAKPSSGFYNALKTQGGAKGSSATFVSIANDDHLGANTVNEGAVISALTSLSLFDGLVADITAAVNKFNTAVLANQDAYDYELKVVVSTDYETAEYIFQCKFDRSSAVFTAQSVSVDKTSVVL